MKMRTTICFLFALASIGLYAGPQAIVEGEPSAKFGSYPAKEAKIATFIIVNKGDTSLKILGVRNTCDCVESGISIGTEFDAKNCEIPPGSKAMLKLKVLPDSIHEPYVKSVYVQTDDPANKFLVFTIFGDAIPILKAVPQAEIVAGHIKLDSTWMHELKLEATESGVEIGTPRIESEIQLKASVDVVSENSFKLKIGILPSSSSPGRFSAKVFVPILKPEGWKPIEVNIAGFAGIELLASPAKIFIPASEMKHFEKSIELRVFSPEPIKLKPEDISFTAPKGVSVALSGEDGELVMAKITLGPDALKSLDKNSFIEFKMPGAKLLSSPLIRR
jgi:hypothetical protein